MGRQEGLVRLLESAENLVDPDRFHVNGVGLLVLVLAEQHNFVFSRLCLSGDLDEQVPARAHPDRPGQHFRADDAGVAALAAVVVARPIEVPAVTAATTAAKVRFNFPRADQCRLSSKAATMTGRNPVNGTC
jgi:hypothetical protein